MSTSNFVPFGAPGAIIAETRTTQLFGSSSIILGVTPMMPVFSDPTPRRIISRSRRARTAGGASPAIRGGVYVLKVEDESTKINVNGGFLDDQGRGTDALRDWQDPDVVDAVGHGHGWNKQLARVLDVLGAVQEIDLNGNRAVDLHEDWNGNGAFDPPPIGIAGMGQAILRGRPQGGYRSIEDVQRVLGTTVDLSPYLTVRSWVDRTVVRPNAERLTAHLTSVNEEKKLRGALLPEEVGRSPVNLNGAPRSVLISLLQGISSPSELGCNGGWFDPVVFRTVPLSFSAATTYRVSAVSAGRIAERMIASRPFSGWGGFRIFAEKLVLSQAGLPPAISGFPESFSRGIPSPCWQLGPAHMILANFDPNTHSNEQCPDAVLWQWLDKGDLLDYSTEGVLHPTGAVRIASAGRVVDTLGGMRSLAEISVQGDLFTLVRHTTQKEFMGGRQAGAQDPPGSGRYPLSLAAAGASTAGLNAGIEWWGGVPPGRGVGVMTYPCPPVAVAAGNAAEFDGYVGLATVEIENSLPSLLDPPGLDWSARFVHHFDGDGCSSPGGGWSADRGVVPALQAGPVDSGLLHGGPVCDAYLPRGAELKASVWPDSGEPGTLLPDGIHLQEGRCPAFSPVNLPEDADDAPFSDHGVLSYWVKRVNHLASTDFNLGTLWTMMDLSIVRCKDVAPRLNSLTHAIHIGYDARYSTSTGPRIVAGMIVENAALDSGDDHKAEQHHEIHLDSSYTFPGGRWSLMTAIYDTDEANNLGTSSPDAHLWLRCAHPSSEEMEIYPAPESALNFKDLPPMLSGTGGIVSTPYDPVGESLPHTPGTSTVDPTCAIILGGEMLYSDASRAITFQNHVIDEFSIYDLGDDAPRAYRNASFLVDQRFQDGRYYKGDDATFESAALAPFGGGPARILFARWTDRLPTEATLEPRITRSATYGPRWIDSVLAGDDDTGQPRVRVEMELLDGAGNPLCPLAQGRPIRLALTSFRYRANFRTVLADPLVQPVLETAYLDDIAFACQGPDGPRILVWTE